MSDINQDKVNDSDFHESKILRMTAMNLQAIKIKRLIDEKKITFIDPLTIITIISILIQLYKLWQVCRAEKKQMLRDMKSPGRIGNVVLMNCLRSSLPNTKRKDLKLVAECFYEAGQKVEEKDVDLMVAEIV